jgi:hypothetical protein
MGGACSTQQKDDKCVDSLMEQKIWKDDTINKPRPRWEDSMPTKAKLQEIWFGGNVNGFFWLTMAKTGELL